MSWRAAAAEIAEIFHHIKYNIVHPDFRIVLVIRNEKTSAQFQFGDVDYTAIPGFLRAAADQVEKEGADVETVRGVAVVHHGGTEVIEISDPPKGDPS